MKLKPTSYEKQNYPHAGGACMGIAGKVISLD